MEAAPRDRPRRSYAHQGRHEPRRCEVGRPRRLLAAELLPDTLDEPAAAQEPDRLRRPGVWLRCLPVLQEWSLAVHYHRYPDPIQPILKDAALRPLLRSKRVLGLPHGKGLRQAPRMLRSPQQRVHG